MQVISMNEMWEVEQGSFFFSDDIESPPSNDNILNIMQVIKAVMSSATEAEIHALYINTREVVYIRQNLVELGYLKKQMLIKSGN